MATTIVENAITTLFKSDVRVIHQFKAARSEKDIRLTLALYAAL